MNEILKDSSFFPVMLTIFSYEVALLLKRKWKSSLCNPLIISVIIVIVILKLIGIPNEEYQVGIKHISFFLTPATICLAIPLYDQIRVLRQDIKSIFIGVISGVGTSLGCIILLSVLFEFERGLFVSLLPKSVTTAMGLALSESNGGIAAITTAAIIATGVLGSLFGTSICKIFKINHPIACGVAFGTTSHVIGTAKAAEQSELTGAVSSLSLVVAGIITAIVFPFLTNIH